MKVTARVCTGLWAAVAAHMLAGCGTCLMPTPNVYLARGPETFARVPPPLRSSEVDVLYVTDRDRRVRTDGRLDYGWRRSPSVAFGSCVVGVGKGLSWSRLVEESLTRRWSGEVSLSIQRLTELGRGPAEPVARTMVGGKPADDPAALARREGTARSFLAEVRRRLALTSRKEAFVYVHGNFATFDRAAFVLAGLWHFLGREGVPILYSWPAGSPGGLLKRYTYDRESGEFTVHHLKSFLRVLAACPEVQRIHILAHSQGANVVCTALRELFIESRAAGQDPRRRWKIANLVLAAPDFDLEVGLQRIVAERLGTGVERVTLYRSDTDTAMDAAEWLFRSGRVGKMSYEDVPEYLRTSMGVGARFDLIHAKVKGGLSGHYYFYTDPAVSSDLVLLLRDGRPPGAAHGRPLIELAPHYWQIKPGYPEVGTSRRASVGAGQ